MTDPADNPFESPLAAPDRDPATPPEYRRTAHRPVAPIVFGVLSIVFGGFGILGLLVGMLVLYAVPGQEADMAQMGYSPAYTLVTQIGGGLISVLLLWAGICLVRYRYSGRVLFNAYAYTNITFLLLNTLYVCLYLFPSINFDAQIPAGFPMKSFMIGGTIISATLNLIFPVLGLFFLNRPSVRAHLA